MDILCYRFDIDQYVMFYIRFSFLVDSLATDGRVLDMLWRVELWGDVDGNLLDLTFYFVNSMVKSNFESTFSNVSIYSVILGTDCWLKSLVKFNYNGYVSFAVFKLLR